MYLKDPSTKQPSPTLTMVFIGVSVALIKLLFADSTIYSIKLGSFSGSDFAMVVSPFLALYGHKRQVMARNNQAEPDKEA